LSLRVWGWQRTNGSRVRPSKPRSDTRVGSQSAKLTRVLLPSGEIDGRWHPSSKINPKDVIGRMWYGSLVHNVMWCNNSLVLDNQSSFCSNESSLSFYY
jgi:hypothetical protein